LDDKIFLNRSLIAGSPNDLLLHSNLIMWPQPQREPQRGDKVSSGRRLNDLPIVRLAGYAARPPKQQESKVPAGQATRNDELVGPPFIGDYP